MCEGGKEARNIKTWNFLIVLHILSEWALRWTILEHPRITEPNILYLNEFSEQKLVNVPEPLNVDRWRIEEVKEKENKIP